MTNIQLLFFNLLGSVSLRVSYVLQYFLLMYVRTYECTYEYVRPPYVVLLVAQYDYVLVETTTNVVMTHLDK